MNLDAMRRRDDEENKRTRVPSDQELRVRMVWGVELYGPSEVESLYAGLRKLGWGLPLRQDKDSALDWIRHQRSYGSGGWFNVGRVVGREHRGQHFMVDNYAPLPPEVCSLLVRIFQISPSLTGVLVGFELTDSAARRYEYELNQDRKTFLERSHHPGTVSFVTPERQKRQAVALVQANFRRLVAAWFDQCLPGYFCGLQRPMAFPAMELLTVEHGPILHEPPDEPQKIFFGWRRLVANVPPHDVWTYADGKGLQLAMNAYGDDEDQFHIIVALDISAYPAEELKYSGGQTPGAYCFVCNELLDGLLVHSSTMSFLREQLRDLHTTRETLRMARSGRRNTVRILKEIQLFFDRTLGTPVIARELAEKAKEFGWYRHDCPKFTKPNFEKGNAPYELPDVVCRGVHFVASRLTEEEVAMRGHFEQLSTVLNVRESVKAQRRMEWLAVLALAVAVASLIVALTSSHAFASELESIWQFGVSPLSHK